MKGGKGADPYVPGHGDPGYDVLHHDLTLTYALPSNRLEGEAVLTCRAVESLTQLHLDLALTPKKVSVSGRSDVRFRARGGRLVITLPEAVEPGEQLTVRVRYAGNPRPLRLSGFDPAGWEELEDGVIVASQPHGASSWMPCNNRPSARSTYQLTFTTAADYHVEFSGERVSSRRHGASRTWVFRQEDPIPAYLATVQVGPYTVTEQEAVVPIRVVGPAGVRGAGFTASFGRQPEMMTCFVEAFGPYPYPSYTVVITDDDLEIPLESASLSTFGRNFVSADWENVRLVAHELAHQWFGNAVTVERWADIWLHEGFACYAEWFWSEASGGRTTREWAEHHHGRLAQGPAQPAPLTAPTAAHMFDDWVYKRGALVLHALRVQVGDDLFFEILRTWVDAHRHSSITTDQFLEHCASVVGHDLAPVLSPWLEGLGLPDLP